MASAEPSDPTLPVPPKSPASAYSLFVKDWFPSNKSAYTTPDGKVSVQSMASAMGSAWSSLTQAAKDEYNAKAKDLKKAFDLEYRKWYDDLTPETIKAIEKESGKKVHLPGGKKAYRKELDSRPGNPGRPVTAFFEYLSEFRESKEAKSLTGKDGITLIAKKAGEKWKAMSHEEKEVSLGRTCGDR
jgi:hypothetical protein